MKLRCKAAFISLLFFGLIAWNAQAQSSVPRSLKGLDKVVERAMRDWQVPGVAVAVVQEGKVIFAKGYGYRDLENKLPVSPNTIMPIGSCTKAFTAASLCLLAEEGRLDLDAPIREYLPDFRMQDEYVTDHLTALDLLTHRTGLPRHDLTWYGSEASRRQLVAGLRYLQPSKEFRASWQYQNLMYVTAGYLAERVSGESWEKLVEKRLLKPLAMSSTSFSVDSIRRSSDYALPYEVRNRMVQRMPFMNIDAIGPAGSINSNVLDMSNWMNMLLQKGYFAGRHVLPGEAIEQMFTPYAVVPGTATNEVFYNTYGLGWFITSYRGHVRVDHGGNIDGFSASVCLMPRESIGIVVLTNLNGNLLTSVVRNSILDRLLKLEQLDWNKKLLDGRSRTQQEAPEDYPVALGSSEENAVAHVTAGYEGDFENPAYGRMVVFGKDGRLFVKFHRFESELKPTSGGKFVAIIDDEKIKISFASNKNGEIEKMMAKLQVGVDDIVFERVAQQRISAEPAPPGNDH